MLRWNLEGGAEPEEIEVSRRAEDEVHKLFLDATGSHAFISLKSGDNFYLHGRSQRPKKVSKMLGVVECAAFDRQQGTENNTKSFLVGTSLGYIYELSFDSAGKERVCQQVYQLETPQPITSLHIETFGAGGEPTSGSGGVTPSVPSGGGGAAGAGAGVGKTGDDFSAVSRIFVMCSTPSPTRLYLFLGGPGYTQVFSPSSLGGESPSFTELPGSVSSADLLCFNKPPHTRAQTFALTTELGIYHGSFLFSSTQTRSAASITYVAIACLYSILLSSSPPIYILTCICLIPTVRTTSSTSPASSHMKRSAPHCCPREHPRTPLWRPPYSRYPCQSSTSSSCRRTSCWQCLS